MSVSRLLLRAAVCVVLVLGAGCSCSEGGDGTGRDGGGARVDGGVVGPGGSCTSSTDCAGTLVCDPATGTCVAEEIPCTDHGDCGGAAFCGPSGICERNGTGGPCVDDASCIPGEVCTGGFCGCEGEQFLADAVPPNVLIVLDQSGSMDDEIDGTSKWDIAVAAIDSLLTDFGAGVRFGLVLYPSDGECGAGNVVVDVGEDTADAIRAAIAATGPDGSTPIGDSLAVLTDYAGLEDPMRANYVLLITDGEERCDGDGEAGATALRMETPEIKTFVVGFGGEVDPDALNAIAVAGGTALPGDPSYYQADDAASLTMAFADIAGAVLSCSYELSEVPPDLEALYVYFDGTGITRDESHADGWDYDPATNQLTFYGAACEALRSGAITDLVIVHGCPILVF